MGVYPSEIESDSETGWLDLTRLGVASKPAGSSGVFNYTVLPGKHKIKTFVPLFARPHEYDCLNKNFRKGFI